VDREQFDLLVVGEINPDVVVAASDPRPVFGQAERIVDSITLTIGSSSVILACGAARLGLRTAVAGKVGLDTFGEYMLHEMRRHGLDVSHCVVDPTLPTGASVILSAPTDRAILSSLGVTGTLRVDELPVTLLEHARHLHVGSYYLQEALQPDLPALFRNARSQGLTCSLDCNWDPTERWNGLDEVLSQVDIFLPNAEEAMRIARRTDAVAAAHELARRGSIGRTGPPLTVVTKCGPDGAFVIRGQEEVHATALRVPVVDTTGAGDAFGAGFLYGYLAGWTLADALELATACGSLSTTQPGGTAGQPTLQEARVAVSDRPTDRFFHGPRLG